MRSTTTIEAGAADPAAAVVSDRTVIDLVAQLPLAEKVALLTGSSTWLLRAIPSIGLRSMAVSDGPIGVRGTEPDGPPSAQMPAPSATAATWDVAMQIRLGDLMAAEARRKSVDVVLAPVVNLQRSPVGGRHFECLSEDPLLTARLAAAFVRAIQRHGVAACVKHFVGNETETGRTEYLSRIDERTLREVYLAPFEAVVEAGVWTVMAAYNGIARDGVDLPATAHGPLLNGVLKGEWGFDGVVMSDWLATRSVVEPAVGGLDLVMPGPGGPWADGLLAAVGDGQVPEPAIDDKVARILRLAQRVGALIAPDDPQPPSAAAATTDSAIGDDVVALLTEAAARSTVVLRNSGDLLPVDPALPGRIALIGHNAMEPFTQGGGSASVTPAHVSAPVDALRKAFVHAEVTLHRGGATMAAASPVPAGILVMPDGGRGMRVELLDEQGRVIESFVALDASDLWFPVNDPAAASARITTDLHLGAPGLHCIEVAPVGAHRVIVDGELRSTSDEVAGAEVVLNSAYSNPPAVQTDLFVESPRHVRIAVAAQIVDAESYGRFVRLHVRYRPPGPSLDEEIDEAVAAAAASDLAIVVVGTNPETESEGWDRPDLQLPGRQNELVQRVAAANPRTVVVVNAGAPAILPWLDIVPATLWWWLPGQEAGTSLAAVLTGAIEPSGRLPWTLPSSEEDVPIPHGIPDARGIVDYVEGVDVSYRGWDRLGRTPAREFGYGLGYAQWAYHDLELVTPATDAPVTAFLTARVTVENTGRRDGREVVQVYLSTDDEQRPVRWLAGFEVVDVEAGATVTVEVALSRRSFEIWSSEDSAWVLPAVAYRVQAGRSSRDLRLVASYPASG